MAKRKQYGMDVVRALSNFPYFVLRNEMESGYNLYAKELLQIKQNYLDYRHGANFYTEGSAGDYVPSDVHFKIARTLIDKEARFMFSRSPDIVIKPLSTEEGEKKQAEQYQKLVNAVLKDRKNNFSKALIKSAKDCFIAGRVACLVDYSDRDGILIHFYSALQFYYETEPGSDRIVKFISFDYVNKSKSAKERMYLVNRYEERDRSVYMRSTLYDGSGNIKEQLIPEQKIELNYIPAVVIENDGTLEDDRGVSEIESLVEYESGYSRLGNGDIDSERKGMNPIRYTVDMNSETTENLSSGAGAFWDLRSEQNQNEVHPMVGTLAPAMNHTEPVKVTLKRLETAMYNEVDVPNISDETLSGVITSGKTIEALYFPLQTRCDEKLETWRPAIGAVIETVIDLALLNRREVISKYVLTGLDEILFSVEVIENYALMKDENEEKSSDLSEIASNARSRKSYIKKWRGTEFESEDQIEEELMQIAIENNMFDTMSMNTQVQAELSKRGTEREVDSNIEDLKAKEALNSGS